jgi:PAS domain S-box-containing protein
MNPIPLEFSVWVIPYGAMALITSGIAFVAWSRREQQGAIGLFFDQVGLMLAALVLVLLVSATDPALKAFLWKAMFVPLYLAALAWTHMALSYADSKHLINRYTAWGAVVSGVALAIGMFAPVTGQYFLADWTMEGGVFRIEPGGLFWVMIFGWVAPQFGTGAVALGRLFYKQSGFGPQLALLITGITIVFASHLLFPLQRVPVEVGPLGSLVKTLLFLTAILRYGMLDVAPVAREKLVENMNDPVLVINENDRIADLNPAAKQLVGVEPEQRVEGGTLSQVLADEDDVLLGYVQAAEGIMAEGAGDDAQLVQENVALPVKGEGRHFDLVISPLVSRGGEVRGKLIVLRDISELKRRERELREEQERSQALLLNILPARVVEQLNETEEYVADSFEEATVLFADIVNFTSYAQNRPAREVVRILNDIFTRFDRIVNQKGLEKIKTVGDEYFVASGVPEFRSDHASAVAELAWELQEEVAHFQGSNGAPFQLRIGINSGPLVGGIIGEEKFIYDVWGHTVNLGSRMESQGVPGEIQVTPAAKKAIEEQSDGRFAFERRGPIHVKGTGEITTFFLRSAR